MTPLKKTDKEEKKKPSALPASPPKPETPAKTETPGPKRMVLKTLKRVCAGDARVPVLFTWIGFVGIRIPLAYALIFDTIDLGAVGHWRGAGLGLYGAWLAMFVVLIARGGFFAARFARGKWRRIEV